MDTKEENWHDEFGQCVQTTLIILGSIVHIDKKACVIINIEREFSL